MIFYLFWDQKFTQKFNIPIGMLCPYFPLSEKLLLFTGSLLLSVVLSTTAELVRNADSQVPPPDLLNLNLHLDKIPRRFMCTFKSPRVTSHHSEGPFSFISPHAIGAPPMCKFSSVAQSCPTLCNPVDCSSLSCPSPTPRRLLKLHPLSWWCHPAISSSVVPFSPCLQSFPASGSFPMCKMLG